ncbi:peptidoglycan/LPS O-acetylase OafA/YrhL [Salibacterium salarium]|uniref:acyltransferase family protein n=1 Tax=Salibacterium salarium TaxID=284579 RepID=UPI00277D390E|nr:acyltransferase [Salibacterium salarium]MDQ0299623.1 peptidoglycan/LPS O-acetylase OafA/YrhL [Salibacterium salarium]
MNRKDIIPSLNGIRGLAFLIVFLGHMSIYFPGLSNHNITGVPKTGVWLFFVLSSFLLTYYFLSKPERARILKEWVNYFFRRFMRIMILYFIVVTIYFLFKIRITDTEVYLKHLILQGGEAHFWTMPVEMGFYALLPLVTLILIGLLKLKPIYILLTLSLIIVVHQMIFPYTDAVYSSINVFQYLPVFVCGCFTAAFHILLKKVDISRNVKILFDILCILLIIGIVLLIPGVREYVFGIPTSGYLINWFIHFGLIWSVFILLMLNGYGIVRKFFESKVFIFLGHISFSGYLIHWFFRETTIDFSNGVFIYIIGTLTLSYLMYRYIEKPLSKLTLIKNKGIVYEDSKIRKAN